jgi:hypothetical protein
MPVTSSKKKRSPTLDRANSQLGMNHRTASHILNRTIFHSLLMETNRDTCLRCSKTLTAENYSIEHLEEWLDSADPKANFYSLDNIEFVCKKCNSTYNRGRMDVRISGIPLVKPISRPLKPLLYKKDISHYEDITNLIPKPRFFTALWMWLQRIPRT